MTGYLLRAHRARMRKAITLGVARFPPPSLVSETRSELVDPEHARRPEEIARAT